MEPTELTDRSVDAHHDLNSFMCERYPEYAQKKLKVHRKFLQGGRTIYVVGYEGDGGPVEAISCWTDPKDAALESAQL